MARMGQEGRRQGATQGDEPTQRSRKGSSGPASGEKPGVWEKGVGGAAGREG